MRLSLVGGQQAMRFHLLEYASRYLGCPVDTTDLITRDGRWWLHVVVSVAAPDVTPTEQIAHHLDCYHLMRAARGTLLRQHDDSNAAKVACKQAAQLAESDTDRRFLSQQIEDLSAVDSRFASVV